MTTRAQQYVTKASVARANARLVDRARSPALPVDNPYERYHLTRPTRGQLAAAGSRALKQSPNR